MVRMKNKRKSAFLNISTILPWIVLVFSSCLLFTLLHPRISVIFYPHIRQQKLDAFIADIKRNESVSAQEFWQFREFYYPGKIKVDRNGLQDPTFYSPPPLSHPRQLLLFKSKYVESHEYVLNRDTNELNSLFSDGKSYKLIEYSDRFELFFMKSIKDMSVTNGFFDYKDKDVGLLKNKVWFVATKITK